MKDVNRYKTEADTKSGKPKVDLDYTKTRSKRLNKFEKVGGMKVVKAGWVEPLKTAHHEQIEISIKDAGNAKVGGRIGIRRERVKQGAQS
jgi:hypothetical protein